MVGKTEVLTEIREVVETCGKGRVFKDCCILKGQRDCIAALVMLRLKVPDEVIQEKTPSCIDVFDSRFDCAELTPNAASVLERAHRAQCWYRNWGKALNEAENMAKIFEEE